MAMYNGKSFESDIEQEIAALNVSRKRISENINSLNEDIDTQDKDSAGFLTDIARIKIKSVLAGENIGHLGDRILTMIEEFKLQSNNAEREVDHLERSVKEAYSVLNTNEQIFESKKKLKEQAFKSREYLELEGLVEHLIVAADKAHQLVQKVFADCDDKKTSFESSKYFNRLMGRRYGEPEYKGRFLGAAMDRYIAAHFDYDQARRDWKLLHALPEAANNRHMAAITALEEASDALHRFIAEKEEQINLPAAEERLNSSRARYESKLIELDQKKRSLESVSITNWEDHEGLVDFVSKWISKITLPSLSRSISSIKDKREAAATEGYIDAQHQIVRLRMQEAGFAAEYSAMSQKIDKLRTLLCSLADRNLLSCERDYRASFKGKEVLGLFIDEKMSVNEVIRHATNCSCA